MSLSGTSYLPSKIKTRSNCYTTLLVDLLHWIVILCFFGSWLIILATNEIFVTNGMFVNRGRRKFVNENYIVRNNPLLHRLGWLMVVARLMEWLEGDMRWWGGEQRYSTISSPNGSLSKLYNTVMSLVYDRWCDSLFNIWI